MATKIYAAYGVTMNPEMMQSWCPKTKQLGVSSIKNYRLMFKGEPPLSLATIEEYSDYVVPIVIWELDLADEPLLDKWVGYPEHYEKREMEIEMPDGKMAMAMIYAKSEYERLNYAETHYVADIYESYERYGFDLAILKGAEKFSERYRHFRCR